MLDRYRIRMMPRASNDIVGICAYIEQNSPQNAASVASELLDAIDSLDVLPARYRIHEHRRDSSKTVHAMPVPPFIIYYRVVERHHVVEVVAILHGSRRQPRRFR